MVLLQIVLHKYFHRFYGGNMRLMLICHGAGNGGAERMIVTLAQQFYDRGNDILLFTTRPPYNDYEINKGIHRSWSSYLGKSSIKRNVKCIKDIRNNIRQFKPDCIISFSTVPNILTLVSNFGFNKKIIISERTDPARHPSSSFYRILRRILYPIADKIVFQTPDAMNYFPANIRNKGTIIFNPIRNDLPNVWEGEREHKIVGIGSLSEQKNWFMALQACESFFEDHPDYRLDIYGEGPEKEKLLTYINTRDSLKHRVNLKGFSQSAITDLNSAMMYISSSDYEGISNSMLEALATGVPSICTDCPVGGARIFINEENGFLVPVKDSVAMYKCMKKIADNKDLRTKMSINAIKIREQLQLDKIMDQWEKEVSKP